MGCQCLNYVVVNDKNFSSLANMYMKKSYACFTYNVENVGH